MNEERHSKVVDDFVHLVRQYLTLIDVLPGPNAKDFLSNCAIVLPQIYSLAHQLPDVELPDDDPLEGSIGIESPIGRIIRALGKYDLYYEVFDPVTEKDAIPHSLSNDLADIYLDLMRPLLKHDSGDEANQRLAIWEWKFHLQIHWGHHLVDALRPIHRLIYEHLGSDTESQKRGI